MIALLISAGLYSVLFVWLLFLGSCFSESQSFTINFSAFAWATAGTGWAEKSEQTAQPSDGLIGGVGFAVTGVIFSLKGKKNLHSQNDYGK